MNKDRATYYLRKGVKWKGEKKALLLYACLLITLCSLQDKIMQTKMQKMQKIQHQVFPCGHPPQY